ncbi:Predicted ATPase [Nocardioides alpinus]|uniref:Predicted ATPase n=1 Tax=Nocardioides alpinus TaxID=748909 RepID=A0A1I0WEK1_9ACTN|nr:BTAD domain-containing putative transcriptional regulator [Nocardioides alpinus]SFA87142.1 Predicted ATPase [Nocardioides alpinus]
MGTIADLDEPTIRLLGPVEVDGGYDVTLAPRERALLARLAIDTGRTVTVDRLVDDLWGDHPPASARNALQVYVSHLRSRLGRESISSRGGGYRLELGPDRIDSLAFERLVAVGMGLATSGRAAEATHSLDTATGLWRGEPLADLAGYPFARVEAARLDELRATGLEHLAEVLLAVDDLDRLEELTPQVREFPFRERLRAAVMTGLYRQGRAVDALALYAEVVDQLREELGLEPGPTLKALQRAILTDDPALTASLPSGELTLVATVLDASAALEGQLADAYGDALLTHRDLLRSAFAACSGLTFPTDGERLLAAFPTALDALRAAASGHRALAGHPFPHGVRVQVRMGVHTGTPRVVEQHYVGGEVHRVLQVALAASGGQTLATGTTARLLGDDVLAADGLRVTDLGRHRLPDAAQPEHLHQVSETDEEFPPPRSLGGRSSLPRPVVRLVGRDQALAALVEESGRPGSGLTTLVGPGGAGKTRLAIEVADRVGRTVAGGVYFVALETAGTLEDAWGAVAAALDLAIDTPAPDAVLAQLAERRTLLVLDNVEQLDEVATAIEDLLGVDGEVRLLATSRRPTGVRGERLLRLDPITDGRDASLLFASYAELARPGFVLDDDNREAVARICRRVDGLPLGIELAAARVRQLLPRTLADILDSGHDLVVGGPSRPDRQRDLHALTDWSFRLLEPHQQRLLELLALFVGGADLDTVARLPATDGRDPVAVALELADASLVRVTEDGAPRITMLETVRAYVAGNLAASGRSDSARDLHLAAHVDLARRLHPRVASRRRATEVLLRERSNVEAALDRALGSGQEAAAAEIISDLGEAWHQLGPRAFGYIERTAARCPSDSHVRGWLTYWDYRRRWDTEVDDRLLLDLLLDAEARLRAAGDIEPLAALLAYGGNLGVDVGLGVDWGVDRAREAVGLAEGLGDDWLIGLTATALVRELSEAGRTGEARTPLELGRSAASRLGDVARLDALTMNEAELLAQEGRHSEAWALAAPAAVGLVSSRSEGMFWSAAHLLARLAAHDRPAAAASLMGVGLGALDRMGSTPSSHDLEHFRDRVRPALDLLGAERFDSLVAEGRSWSRETAVARVLDLLG